ncbi:glycosyltransferase [Prosthecomicrobium pneumaticum]|uniref:Glycosyltransferase n=1 Tax=Prosthecomicrobium pneumaticum TaxID=81895 RepID=A0A7W9FM33_9HYPH|nr:glycosyltransferase [Prosthecomicrobium pneumaticum]MBB5753180.1 hypothetical protein [Prosthecomicrobium pneumaticum]
MLIDELGFVPPGAAEIARVRAEPPPEAPTVTLLPATVISADPLISYSGIGETVPLGLAGVAGSRLAGRTVWFLFSPTRTIESEEAVALLRRRAVLHRLSHPQHRLVFLCNTPEETALVRATGEAAFFYNKTANAPEAVFRPLGTPREFDAIYNAQLVPWKRHELSLAIPSCAFLFYRNSLLPEPAAEAAIIARHKAEAPGHVFLNAFDRKGEPVRLSPPKVNRALGRAHVGLCLSETEGAMFASTEYLLAGLPVVSTPSIGGRHVHFDPDFCLTVPPDPRAVAQAVAALKARAIPAETVRAATLARLERERARFLALLDAILEEGGATHRLAGPWPFRKAVMMEWQAPEVAIERAVKGDIDAFLPRKRARGLRRLWRKLTGQPT